MNEKPTTPINEAMLNRLALNLFKGWEQHQAELDEMARLGRSIVQNVGNQDIQLTLRDLIEYTKSMKEKVAINKQHTVDLIGLTVRFVQTNMLPKSEKK